jgi:hypothetical protein
MRSRKASSAAPSSRRIPIEVEGRRQSQAEAEKPELWLEPECRPGDLRIAGIDRLSGIV